ncbi:uncharacterized protein LOC127949140 isoform X1 [Carassius gibelio]|uniref:uncharacterized protein LOC127949140 isoform X1 n=1 Tax=Carassius gibelio TaxID=101364 RepID=UPI002277A96C|nr:uncharacterized protein LOC127949140 isoform X1 [Carassius gibelio]
MILSDHPPTWNLSGVHSYRLLLLFASCLGGMSVPDAVKVRDTAIIPCYKTCDGDILWALTTKYEKLDVLRCVQGTCTEGFSFKNRVHLSNEKSGNPSLIMSPVLYNDEGWYEARCGLEFLCKFHLEVFVPTTVNVSVRGNVTLPCFARTEKNIADDAVSILWKKDDQTVLQVQEGLINYGSGFRGRASVALHHYKDGDLSLNMLRVTTADKGLYRCYHNTDEEHGYPAAVTLSVTAHQKLCVKRFGDNLTLDLFGSDSVTVTFTGSEAKEIQVCSVTGNNTTCSFDYDNRVSVMNYSLVLRGLTLSDGGTFTVKDNMGEVISINTVTVEGVAWNPFFVSLLALPILLLLFIGLFLWRKYHRTSQVTENHSYYNARESTVVIESAYIGVPQQETNPNISGDVEDYPGLAVEETMPVIPSTEKQDSIDENM